MQPTTIGLDLVKRVFQLPGVAADRQVVLRRQVLASDLPMLRMEGLHSVIGKDLARPHRSPGILMPQIASL